MRTIAVIGSINMDLVVAADRLPREGETVLGREYHVVCGGKGANQAVAAARFGGRVHMVGCVGDDEYGRRAKANLADRGVGVRAVRTVRGEKTGVALIVVDRRGRNLIAVAPNANSRLSVPRRPFDIVIMQLETPYAVPRAKLFILNPAPASLEALRAGGLRPGRGARQGTSAQRGRGSLRPLDGVDVVVPNEREAEALTGDRGPSDAARELLKMGARRAVITLGENGAYDSASGRVHAAFRVAAVDTVGAGDAFVGALAVALAGGRPDAVRFAQAAAALKCERCGAQNLPSVPEIERLLR